MYINFFRGTICKGSPAKFSLKLLLRLERSPEINNFMLIIKEITVMKRFGSWIAVILIISVGVDLIGQDCSDFFPQKEGTVLKYVSYDKKDKVSGTSEMSFSNKEVTADGVTVTFVSKFSDDSNEALYESEQKVECRGGVLYIDAGKFLDPSTMSAYETMEVEVSADNLELPLESPAGTQLGDGSVTAVVRSNGIKIITIMVQLTDRKIEAMESIKTPAGEFDCIKYSYNILTQMGFVKVNMSALEWYSPEYGTIISETYNKKGKKAGSTVLESIL